MKSLLWRRNLSQLHTLAAKKTKLTAAPLHKPHLSGVCHLDFGVVLADRDLREVMSNNRHLSRTYDLIKQGYKRNEASAIRDNNSL